MKVHLEENMWALGLWWDMASLLSIYWTATLLASWKGREPKHITGHSSGLLSWQTCSTWIWLISICCLQCNSHGNSYKTICSPLNGQYSEDKSCWGGSEDRCSVKGEHLSPSKQYKIPATYIHLYMLHMLYLFYIQYTQTFLSTIFPGE